MNEIWFPVADKYRSLRGKTVEFIHRERGLHTTHAVFRVMCSKGQMAVGVDYTHQVSSGTVRTEIFWLSPAIVDKVQKHTDSKLDYFLEI